MRASKEQASIALGELSYLQLTLTTPDTSKKLIDGFDRVAEFLEAAQRKLPTQSAYDREATKRNVGRRAK